MIHGPTTGRQNMSMINKTFRWETPTDNFKLACNEIHI
jgi:hypothetical protein